MSTNSTTCLTFRLINDLYAVDIMSVREILDPGAITRIPRAPAHMRGVVNLRGSAVPVMDLRLRFGLGAVERTVHTRIIITEIPVEDEVVLVGMLVDSVKEVIELGLDGIEPPPRMGLTVSSDCIRGIAHAGSDFIILLSLDCLLCDEPGKGANLLAARTEFAEALEAAEAV